MLVPAQVEGISFIFMAPVKQFGIRFMVFFLVKRNRLDLRPEVVAGCAQTGFRLLLSQLCAPHTLDSKVSHQIVVMTTFEECHDLGHCNLAFMLD